MEPGGTHNDDPLGVDPANGPGGTSQSYGQEVRLGLIDPHDFNPGLACNPNTTFLPPTRIEQDEVLGGPDPRGHLHAPCGVVLSTVYLVIASSIDDDHILVS